MHALVCRHERLAGRGTGGQQKATMRHHNGINDEGRPQQWTVAERAQQREAFLQSFARVLTPPKTEVEQTLERKRVAQYRGMRRLH